MAGLFGTSAVLITDVNLLIQIISFLVLLISLFYKFKGKIKNHGYLMGFAVVLHFISFIIAMGPSFFDGFDFFIDSTDVFGVQAMWIHSIAGGVALILGFYLVIAWIINLSNVAGCAKRKRIMDITIILWAISLLFGIVTYLSFYT